MFNPDPDFLPIPDPESRSKKGTDPGSRSAPLIATVGAVPIVVRARVIRGLWLPPAVVSARPNAALLHILTPADVAAAAGTVFFTVDAKVRFAGVLVVATVDEAVTLTTAAAAFPAPFDAGVPGTVGAGFSADFSRRLFLSTAAAV